MKYVAATVLFALGGFVGIIIVSSMGRVAPQNLDDPSEWLLVKVYTSLDRQTTARVYVIERLSDGQDPWTVLQNKIIVTRDDHEYEFRWAGDREYAAGWCEIRETDGLLEFLLFESAEVLRVVRFDGETFSFHPDSDRYFSREEMQRLNIDPRWAG